MKGGSNDWLPGRGLPLDLPSAPTSVRPSLQVTDPETGLPVPNTPASSKPGVPKAAKARTRVGHRMIEQIAERLSARDREVLERVAEHRYLSTHQIQYFCFTDHASNQSAARTARRVLAQLEQADLLRSLERRVGGAQSGSATTVWQLAPAGARLVRRDGKNYRTRDPSPRFMLHCLAVADVHVLLLQHRDIEAITEIVVEVEPVSWRRYLGQGGEPRWLQPDLSASLSTRDYTDRWFVEVDLDTESLPALLKKCTQYEAYRASGVEQDKVGAFPLVLWVFTNPLRAERLQRAIARHPGLTPALYRYSTPWGVATALAQTDAGVPE